MKEKLTSRLNVVQDVRYIFTIVFYIFTALYGCIESNGLNEKGFTVSACDFTPRHPPYMLYIDTHSFGNTIADDFVQTNECAAQNKEDVAGVDRIHFTFRIVLPWA